MADVVQLKVTGMDGVLDMLKSLPAEVVSKRGGPVKTALRKGAMVIQKQEKANLLAVMQQAKDVGERHATGLLHDNIIVSRGKQPTGGNGERYLVRVKRKTYPRNGNDGGDPVTTWKTARLLEYGSEKQPPRSFIRSAAATKAQEAIDTATRELTKAIDRIVKKLAKK